MSRTNSWLVMTRRSFVALSAAFLSSVWLKRAFGSDTGPDKRPFTNGLGMKFNPISGASVLFGIWDVRVRDYAVFASETKHEWPKPKFSQTDDDPAVNVSWNDATAFCNWLTMREHASGVLDRDKVYRLPTDAEWSLAAGKGTFPWGETWPPPPGAANYHNGLTHDDYRYTSPVGSFHANEYGIFDMAGNVYQWCADDYNPEMNTPEMRQANPSLEARYEAGPHKVLRGSAWDRGWNWGTEYWKDDLFDFRRSSRFFWQPDYRSDCFGFRVVLAPAA